MVDTDEEKCAMDKIDSSCPLEAYRYVDSGGSSLRLSFNQVLVVDT